MAKAFPPHEGCSDQPDNDQIPVDSAPMLPKLPDGTGVGSASDIPSPTGPIGEAVPGAVSPPNSEQPQELTCVPGILKANINAGATGSVREMVGSTEVGDPFDALNHSTTNGVIGDKVTICYNREGDAFFLIKKSGAVCDCVEKTGTTDDYKQLSGYCNITNLHKVLPFTKELVFVVSATDGLGTPEAPRFKIEFDDAADFVSLIGASDIYPFNPVTQAVSVNTLTGSMMATKSGTLDPITVELKETADTGSQVSGLGGVKKISQYMEDLTGFQIHIVDDTGGFRHLEFYAPDGTTLLFHTATYNTTGDKAVIDDGGAGVTGTITIDNVGAPTTAIRWDWIKTGDTDTNLAGWFIDDLFTKTREKIWARVVTPTKFDVQIYSGGCKIGHTVPGTATGAVAVLPDTPPGGWPCPALGGTITVDRWFFQDPSIIITCPSGECCGSNGCSGDVRPTGCCTSVGWTDSSNATSGSFEMESTCEADPRCCDTGGIGAWQPVSAGIVNPGSGNAFTLVGINNGGAIPCDIPTTFTFTDKNGFAIVVSITPLGFFGVFVIGTVTYTVSVNSTAPCTALGATFPF